MEFSIGPQFSREFSLEDRLIVEDLAKTLNDCLSNKKYSSEIEKMYIGIICVSKGFEPFFMARPLKILKNEPAIEYELRLAFDDFYKANHNQRIKILHEEFIAQSKEILNDKKMKKFEVENFIDDLASCLNLNK